jgi:DNA helicase-2/ATP-dependent DNA helicase PcrA
MKILHEVLDPEQEKIALDSDESRLVLAGPGSGKTRLLTNVAAYRVRATPTAKWRVLCITFSVEATNQLRQRLRDPALGVSRPNRLYVANFHQLGAQILHAYADRAGWPRTSQMLDNPEELIKEVLGELHLGYLNVHGVGNALGRLRNRRAAVRSPIPAETLQRIAAAYDARKHERAVWDFDDLIIRSVELLDRVPAVREILQTMFGYIVVDELQDTSGYQLELLARISNEGETPLFGVADDDQMIYAWRDARPENIAEFETRFGDQERFLVGNYRCPRRIVEAANVIISATRPDGDQRAAESRVKDREGQVLLSLTPANMDHGSMVARVVQQEITDGVPVKDIAVLSAIAFKFPDLKLAFDASQPKIPYVHIGDHSLAATPLARVLLATLNCQDRLDDPAAHNRLLLAISRALPEETREDVLALAARLTGARSPDAALSIARDELAIPADDSAAVHIRRIVLAATQNTASYSRSFAATSTVLEWNRLDARLRREEQSVKIMTTFGAKGLEFDTVVMPYFETGLAPYRRKDIIADEGWWAEERRKLYVAMTRARYRLIFVCSGEPSPFLGELADRLASWSADVPREPPCGRATEIAGIGLTVRR